MVKTIASAGSSTGTSAETLGTEGAETGRVR